MTWGWVGGSWHGNQSKEAVWLAHESQMSQGQTSIPSILSPSSQTLAFCKVLLPALHSLKLLWVMTRGYIYPREFLRVAADHPPYPGWRKWSSGKILFHGRNGLSPCSLLGSEMYSGPGSATTSLGPLGQHTTLLWASLYSPVNSFNKHAEQPKRRARNMQVTKP